MIIQKTSEDITGFAVAPKMCISCVIHLYVIFLDL